MSINTFDSTVRFTKGYLYLHPQAVASLGEHPDGRLAPASPVHEGVALPSQARTSSVDSADLTNPGAGGLAVFIDVTAVSGSPSVVFTIQGKDPASGSYYDLLASAAITAVGFTVLRVHPALTAAANLIAKDALPKTWRIRATAANASSITYSVGYSLLA
jgi:hypothetical protein